jgi:hypothetical protein
MSLDGSIDGFAVDLGQFYELALLTGEKMLP